MVPSSPGNRQVATEQALITSARPRAPPPPRPHFASFTNRCVVDILSDFLTSRTRRQNLVTHISHSVIVTKNELTHWDGWVACFRWETVLARCHPAWECSDNEDVRLLDVYSLGNGHSGLLGRKGLRRVSGHHGFKILSFILSKLRGGWGIWAKLQYDFNFACKDPPGTCPEP